MIEIRYAYAPDSSALPRLQYRTRLGLNVLGGVVIEASWGEWIDVPFVAVPAAPTLSSQAPSE